MLKPQLAMVRADLGRGGGLLESMRIIMLTPKIKTTATMMKTMMMTARKMKAMKVTEIQKLAMDLMVRMKKLKTKMLTCERCQKDPLG